ncbi:MAG: DeoR/GlpR transcriptional regulator [Hyphomicrobiales bacterium]|nr:DeoR/GlpR transcriptional regulator [Hyphomicrobiales bacterium]
MSVSFLLPEERAAVIRERLERDGRVVAAELARALGATEDTVRRDLRELAARGLCRRVYGGALPLSPASGAMSERIGRGAEAKAALAREAAKLVSPGQFIFLDAGSTNLALAGALPTDADLTIGVNAPLIAAALLERGGCRVVMIGGALDRAIGGAIDAHAVGELSALRIDLCFLGACAVDDDGNIGAFSFEDAAFKRQLAAASRRIAVAATNEKLGAVARFEALAGRDLDHIVVENDADPMRLARFRELEIDVRRAA